MFLQNPVIMDWLWWFWWILYCCYGLDYWKDCVDMSSIIEREDIEKFRWLEHDLMIWACMYVFG